MLLTIIREDGMIDGDVSIEYMICYVALDN